MTRRRLLASPGSGPPVTGRTAIGHPDHGSIDREAGGFPIVVVLDAFDAWMRAPSEAGRVALERALGMIVREAGAAGAHLEVDAPPLPRVSVGDGTLTAWRPPAAPRAPDGPSAELDQDPLVVADGSMRLRRYELRSVDPAVRLGTLWLDAPDGPIPPAVRALEIALDAGWSRAGIRRTVDRLAALDDATRAIAGVLDLDRVLQLIVDHVRELSGARYAALGIFDERGVVERFLTSGLGPAERERIGAPPRGRGLLGALLHERRSIRLADLTSDPRSAGFPPGHPAMHSFLGVPILMKGRSVGNLYLTEKAGTDEFSDDDQELVELFAVHAGIAIENARLHDQVQRLAIVEERERIGRDLHDGIIQSLYAVGLSLEDLPELMDENPSEAATRVDRAIESLNLTIRDIRNFIFGLRPELLEQATLDAALAALADEFELNTLVDVDLDIGPDPLDLPPEDRTQLLQIARECLSNIARHSHATQATLHVRKSADGLVLDVSDNGRGFDPGAARGPGHQGLANIEGRARALGGELTIQSERGTGTRIIVSLPPVEPEVRSESERDR
jgi:signal transduction histidine kinase